MGINKRLPPGKPWHEDDEVWRVIGPYLFGSATLEKTREQVEAVLAWTGAAPPARFLDLCCGVGRHSLELARRGFAVTGVDRTGLYLREARETAAAEGLEAEFVLADAREFRRDSSFDAATNLFTSFGYFTDPEDDLRVLRNIHRSLVPGGRLVMDMMGREILPRVFEERHTDEVDGITVIQEGRISPDGGWSESRWEVIREGRHDVVEISHRLYSADELRESLESCGFEAPVFYGGFDSRPYDDQALRLIAVARRPL